MTARKSTRSHRVTLRDVASVAQVDPSAVSRAVNNDPRLSVSEETRKRILAVVEELGYRANLGAKGLRTSRTWTIGFVLPNLGNPMYERIVGGVEKAAEARGYGIVLGSQIEGRTAETFAGLLQEGRVDGLLVASSSFHDGFIRSIVEQGPGPVVLVNRLVAGVASSVIIDDEGASCKAVEYLYKLGHEKIGGIFGPSEIDTAVRRRRGFASAMKRYGLDSIEVERTGLGAQDGFDGVLEILNKEPFVTAIYASTFLMGIGALRAASERGRDVPADLSVMCLHDSHLADFLIPPLTTIRLPTEALGVAAVELLVEQIEGGADRAITIEGVGEIIERASTGAPPL